MKIPPVELEEIRTAVKKAPHTQGFLGEQAECSTKTIWRIINKGKCSPINLLAIKKALKLWDQPQFEAPTPPSKGEYQQGLARAATERARYSKVIKGEGWIKTLTEIYGGRDGRADFNLLRVGEKTAPVMVLRVAAENPLKANIESPIDRMQTAQLQPAPDLDDYDGSFLDKEGEKAFRRLRNAELSGGDLYNGPTYDFQRIAKIGERHVVECRVGRYFWTLATSQALEEEFLKAHERNPSDAVPFTSLRLRDRLHKVVHNPISSGDGRAAAIGLSVLTVFYHPTLEWCYFQNPRSTRLGQHNLLNHIIPSGIIGPTIHPDRPLEEFSIQYQALKEIHNELYSAPEREQLECHVCLEQMPSIKRLIKLLTNEKASLRYTGLAMNLLSLRPEICAVLLIHDAKWYEREVCEKEEPLVINREEYLRGRARYSVPREANFNPDHQVSFVQLTPNLEVRDPDLILPWNMTPPASAAIQLGLGMARKLNKRI